MPNNQKGSAIVVLLIILVVVVLAAVLVYFAFLKKPGEVAVSPTPTPTKVTRTATPTPNETAGWMLKSTTKYSLKTPPGWFFKENPAGGATISYPEYIPRITISTSTGTVESSVQKLRNEVKSTASAKINSEKEVIIGGFSGKQLDIYWPRGGAKNMIYDFVATNNVVYQITWGTWPGDEYQSIYT
ncbi:MAG: hypothetical protein AAB488_02785, partial [Patescibacteria group bacterium]